MPPRVRIERPSAARRDEFLAAALRSRSLHRPWIEAPATPAAFDAYLERRAQPSQPGFWVIDVDEDALVGVVNLNELVRGALQSAYLGYYAFAPHARRGFMRAGLAQVCTRAFRGLGLHRLEANIQPANTASIALVRGLGFRLEGLSPRYLKIGGRWRDHERWAVLADEWRARPSGRSRLAEP